MIKKINSASFWPRGKEPYAAMTLFLIILLSGYVTYINVIDKVEKLCNEQPTFSSATFNLKKSSISAKQIFHGGPPKDGIPSLSNPHMISADKAEYLEPHDHVIGIQFQGRARAYPLRILAWHECVNDHVASTYYAITYCPMCDSAAVFDREVDGERLEFGISGLLYQSNVLLYDRQSDPKQESLWSQLQGEAVTGPKTGTQLRTLKFQRVCWQEWREKYPKTQVLSLKTGYKRDYSRNFYSDYYANDCIQFPVYHTNPIFLNKEPMVGVVVDGKAKAYPIRRIDGDVNIVQDQFNGEDIVLKRTDEESFFVRVSDKVSVYRSFWFSWYAFYPKTEIYEPSE